MPPSSKVGAELRFDDFEVNPSEATVRRNGVFIPLQEKPLQVLLALLERPGQVVSREELRNRLWPGDAFGAFEDGLNTAVRKLRIALEDSAESPRFIETIPKRGYRFAAPVRLAPSPTKKWGRGTDCSPFERSHDLGQICRLMENHSGSRHDPLPACFVRLVRHQVACCQALRWNSSNRITCRTSPYKSDRRRIARLLCRRNDR